MRARRASLLAAAGFVAAVSVGLAVGHPAAAALAAALVLAAALAARTALELRPAHRQGQPRPPRKDELPVRLAQIVGIVEASERSEVGVERSLRPLLVPIAAARLGRRGVDLTRAPERAHELLGDVLWQIVRPDRPPATYRVGGGLAEDDLRAAISRLERL